MMAGTAIGQLLAVAASPVLSRLYSPADFGVFSVVSALAMVLSAAAALRFELAIPLPAKETEARALLVLGGLATLVTTGLCTLLLAFGSSFLGTLFPHPGLARWLIWVPLLAAGIASFQLLNQWALRQQRYTATARRNVVSSVSTVVIQLVIGWRYPGPGGLVIGLGGGQALGAGTLLKGANLSLAVTRGELGRVARRYRRFPLLLAPSGLINMAGIHVPLILIAVLYGAEAAGWLGFTQRILALPMMLVGQAVAQVYLSELARTHRTRGSEHVRLFTAASRRLAALAIVSAALVALVAPPLFPAVFGQPWRMSGSMAQALAVGLAAQLVAAPLSQTLIVFERQVLQLAWDIGRLIAVSSAVLIPAMLGFDVLTCVWFLSAAVTITYTVAWTMSRHVIRDHSTAQSRENGTG